MDRPVCLFMRGADYDDVSTPLNIEPGGSAPGGVGQHDCATSLKLFGGELKIVQKPTRPDTAGLTCLDRR